MGKYLYIDPDEEFRLKLLKYLQLYLNDEKFRWNHVESEYKEPTFLDFIEWLRKPPIEEDK